MKNVNVFSTAILLLFGFVLSNCNRNSNAPLSSQDLLIRKTWSVDYFSNGQDLSSDYSGSKILFSNTGAAAYQKDGIITGGYWSITSNGSASEKMILHFDSADTSIVKLNQTWNLADHSAENFQFETISGGNGFILHIKAQ